MSNKCKKCGGKGSIPVFVILCMWPYSFDLTCDKCQGTGEGTKFYLGDKEVTQEEFEANKWRRDV